MIKFPSDSILKMFNNYLKILLLIFSFLFFAQEALTQEKFNYSHSYRASVIRTKSYFPQFDECLGKKKKNLNQCFLECLDNYVSDRIKYPYKEFLEKKDGNASLNLVFSDDGDLTDIISQNESLSNFEIALKEVFDDFPDMYPAESKGNFTEFSLIYTYTFERKKWPNRQAHIHDLNEAFYASVGVDSTFKSPSCDTCTLGSSHLKHQRLIVQEEIKNEILTDSLFDMPRRGYVFGKYTVHNDGSHRPFPYLFLNTTLIPDSFYLKAVNTLNDKVASSEALDDSALGEFGLYLYFDSLGMKYTSDRVNNSERAERMPVFPFSCEGIENPDEQANCTESRLKEYIIKNTMYPDFSRLMGHQGKVFLTFIIDQTGFITDVEVIKGVTPQIDKAAINAVKSLPRFIPAEQRNRPVKLKYTIPISFYLR